jgi:hypothetical protein
MLRFGCSDGLVDTRATQQHYLALALFLEELGFGVLHPSFRKLPVLELAPLPASSQFLNVIASVFSAMARAIIHSSDYHSGKESQGAIDRYFTYRNEHYRLNPKKAGKRIWGLERISVMFSGNKNCQDPTRREAHQ